MKEYWEEEMNIKTDVEKVDIPDIDDDIVDADFTDKKD